MGGAPRASILMGQGDREGAEKILGNCAFFLALIALFLTVVFQIFGRSILLMFGASQNTIPYAWDYMRIYSMGTLFVQLSLGLNAFISAQGYAKTSMYTVMIGAVCNIILDPIFIFGFGMGVKGAALATIISQAISCIWVVRFLISEKSGLRVRRKNLKTDFKVLGPCLLLGIAPCIMQLTESVLNICFNTSLLRYGGDIAVGAMAILGSVMQFSMLPLQGLTQGAQPIISYNYGAMKPDRVKRTFQLLLISCVSFSSLVWAISMFFPHVFVGLFTTDAALTAYTVWAMRIYMSACLIFGAQIACQQTFIAIGNAKASIFLALLRKVFLLIPFIYLFPLLLENKTMGVFLAEPAADLIAVTTTVTLFVVLFTRTLRQMNAKLQKSEPAA